MIFNTGISNPVTEENAGAEYHRDIAKQLTTFL